MQGGAGRGEAIEGTDRFAVLVPVVGVNGGGVQVGCRLARLDLLLAQQLPQPPGQNGRQVTGGGHPVGKQGSQGHVRTLALHVGDQRQQVVPVLAG